MKSLILALVFTLVASPARAAKGLQVYFIDVEGGQATLMVSPSGQSLLVDTGWPGFGGRDAKRIAAAAKAAGVRKIDYLVITHYHLDHVGGVPELAKRLPIIHFVDTGPASRPIRAVAKSSPPTARFGARVGKSWRSQAIRSPSAGWTSRS